MNQDQRKALESALRYFQHSAPKHTLDEEESLFPRLRKAEVEQRAEILATIDLLHTEHLQIEAAHDEIDALLIKWLDENRLTEAETADLHDALTKLHTTYQQHMTLEEEPLFPLAENILPEADIAAIGEEMASRRGVNPDVWKTSI